LSTIVLWWPSVAAELVVRITAGKVKGLKLKTPRFPGVRPMTERARKALFDILGPGVEGARVLDLFCGTGAVGIEALSRGAEEVVFVDASKRSLALVAENLKRAGFSENAKLLRRSLPEGLVSLLSLGSFDYIFITPPYGQGLGERTLKALDPTLLAPEALVVVEERAGVELPSETALLTLADTRRYGEARLFFYRRK